MAYFFLPDEALQVINDLLLGIRTLSAAPKLHLYVSPITPSASDVDADYTAIECSVTGYSAFTLTPGGWTRSVSGGIGTYTRATITFTFSANVAVQSIYGVFVDAVTDSGTKLFGVKPLDAPILIPPTGSTFSYDFSFSDLKRT